MQFYRFSVLIFLVPKLRLGIFVSENVHYAKDAFAGLRLMDEIVTGKAQGL